MKDSEIDELRAENEALREALREIARTEGAVCWCGVAYGDDGLEAHTVDCPYAIARAALARTATPEKDAGDAGPEPYPAGYGLA